MKRLSDDKWKDIFRNLQEMNEEDYFDEGVDWVEVMWLEGEDAKGQGEWVLCYGEELFEDGFKTEKEARDRLWELEKNLL